MISILLTSWSSISSPESSDLLEIIKFQEVNDSVKTVAPFPTSLI